MRSRIVLFIAALSAFVLMCAVPAFAYNEGGSVDPSKTSCASCHSGTTRKGPHGSYSAITSACQMCHSVHKVPAGGTVLLSKATVSDSCSTCHDGTGGSSVYGAIAARGLQPGAQHRIDTTNVIPEGDIATGGDASRTFGGPNGTLSCDDCHSPHDADTVAPFVGDRLRTADDTTGAQPSDRLLRAQPTGAAFRVTQYGSDWCGTCHAGAVNGAGASHNHPVETSATPSEYTYGNVPALASATSTATVLAPLGGSNLGYLMPDPRTDQQRGHAPLCQQCHEDSRAVGQVGAAAPFTVTAPDGTNPSDDPRFQEFPHETVNSGMLVETGDDLCLNCHKASQLP